jgi:hypothetical protein
MTQSTVIERAAAHGDEGRLASRHVTRFGSATFATKRAARASFVDVAASDRSRDFLVPGSRPAQRQRVRTDVCMNTPAQSECRGATAGVFMHAAVRTLWS